MAKAFGATSTTDEVLSNKYHWCDVRGNYALGTTFEFRYEQEKGRRVYDTLPTGTNHTTARRMAAERELERFSPTAQKAPGKRPCRVLAVHTTAFDGRG